MFQNIIDGINNFLQPVKDFIFANNRNPIFWTIIIVVALAIFGFAYRALHKDH